MPLLTRTHSPPPGSGRELLGGTGQGVTRAPRGRLLFGELLGASLPAPDRPLGRREGRGDLELDVGSGPPNCTPMQDRGRLHGTDVRLELRRASCFCVSVVFRLPTTTLLR